MTLRCSVKEAPSRSCFRSGSARLREILELASTASLSHEMGTEDEKRNLLQILTSNRSVSRENVAVELSFPFRLLMKQDKTKLCGRNRPSPRSRTNLPETASNLPLGPRHVIREIYDWLSQHPLS